MHAIERAKEEEKNLLPKLALNQFGAAMAERKGREAQTNRRKFEPKIALRRNDIEEHWARAERAKNNKPIDLFIIIHFSCCILCRARAHAKYANVVAAIAAPSSNAQRLPFTSERARACATNERKRANFFH